MAHLGLVNNLETRLYTWKHPGTKPSSPESGTTNRHLYLGWATLSGIEGRELVAA